MRLVTGAHCRVYINGQAYGRVAELEWEAETPRRMTRHLDTLLPGEAIQQAVSVGGSLTVYRIHGDGGLEAAGLVAPWQNLSREKSFALLVVDRFLDSVLFRADSCSTIRQKWTYRKGLVIGSVGFVGLLWNNETQPAAG